MEALAANFLFRAGRFFFYILSKKCLKENTRNYLHSNCILKTLRGNNSTLYLSIYLIFLMLLIFFMKIWVPISYHLSLEFLVMPLCDKLVSIYLEISLAFHSSRLYCFGWEVSDVLYWCACVCKILFFLSALKIFSLPFVFSSLIMTCLVWFYLNSSHLVHWTYL